MLYGTLAISSFAIISGEDTAGYFIFSFCVMAFIVPCLPHTVLWEKAGLLALLCVVISCVFVTFSMCVLIRFRTKSEVGTVKPSSISFTDRSFFCGFFLLFMFQVCLYNTDLSVTLLVINC